MSAKELKASLFSKSWSGDRLTYEAEASELGLRPGEWPDEIRLVFSDGFCCNLPHYMTHSDGTRHYKSCHGLKHETHVKIFND